MPSKYRTVEEQTINGTTVVLFETDRKGTYSATYYRNTDIAREELSFRDYKRWKWYKDKHHNQLPHWVGRTETLLAAKARFDKMIELLQTNTNYLC